MPSDLSAAIPDLAWERTDTGAIRFRAGDEAGGFEATYHQDRGLLEGRSWCGESGGDLNAWVDSPDDLAAYVGHLLIRAAGLDARERRVAVAKAACRGEWPHVGKPAGGWGGCA